MKHMIDQWCAANALDARNCQVQFLLQLRLSITNVIIITNIMSINIIITNIISTYISHHLGYALMHRPRPYVWQSLQVSLQSAMYCTILHARQIQQQYISLHPAAMLLAQITIHIHWGMLLPAEAVCPDLSVLNVLPGMSFSTSSRSIPCHSAVIKDDWHLLGTEFACY